MHKTILKMIINIANNKPIEKIISLVKMVTFGIVCFLTLCAAGTIWFIPFGGHVAKIIGILVVFGGLLIARSVILGRIMVILSLSNIVTRLTGNGAVSVTEIITRNFLNKKD